MARRKNWSAEQIVAKLRQIEVQIAQGKSLALACKEAEISEQSYYRWRKEYGGGGGGQGQRLKWGGGGEARFWRGVGGRLPGEGGPQER